MNNNIRDEIDKFAEKLKNGIAKLDAYYYLRSVIEAVGLTNDPTSLRILNSIKSPSTNMTSITRAINLISDRVMRIGVGRKGSSSDLQERQDIIRLGTNMEGKVWGIPFESLPRHILMAGNTGSGKTHTLIVLIRELIKRTKVWVVDFKKDARKIISIENNIPVLMWRYLKLNPLVNPRSVALVKWMPTICELIVQSFDIGIGGKFMLKKYMEQIYAKYNPEKTGIYPSLIDLYDMMRASYEDKSVPQSEREKLSRCLDKLSGVTEVWSLLGYSRGYCIDDLLHENMIIELDGLTTEVQRFIAGYLFCFAFNHFLESENNEKVSLTIVCDEAKFIFGKGL
jgi:hypothetical protein